MKRLILLVFLLLPGVLHSADYPSQGVVKKVIDGDTIELKSGDVVRYIGIDAPETIYSRRMSEAFWKEATEANRELVEGKTVRLEYDKQVKHDNRLLAYVYVGEIFVNGELVRKGFALYSPFGPNRSKDTLLFQYENEARKNRLGIWALPLKNPSKGYIASKIKKEGEIKKFHRIECPHAGRIANRNKVSFKSIDEALDEGYRPCRTCNPLERCYP
ncbi:MAG: thermonuclease family protein [Nitrospirae bacterium]|nr:thermonuclease family protein [Nitrospirota bacterium]